MRQTAALVQWCVDGLAARLPSVPSGTLEALRTFMFTFVDDWIVLSVSRFMIDDDDG